MIRLALRVRREDAEVALAELLELVPGGVEEADLGDGRVEFAIYGAPGELPALPDLRAAAGAALVDVATSEVPDDWADRWRAFHRPVTIGDRLFVRPPWEAPRPGLVDVVVDPGQAFGTGAHATTCLCLELLLALAPAPLVDLGCGSGVLAIAAAKLGFAPVAACDHDPLAVAATQLNARANGVTVAVERFDVRAGPAPSAPVVVANIVRPVLLELAARGFAGEAPRALVLSGLLTPEADEAAAAFGAGHGLVESRRVSAGDWAALTLVRGSG
jgi:ribosomal protein L11 methyltransferase